MRAPPERFRNLRAALRLWGETLRALGRSPGAVIGGVLFGLIIAASLFFPWVYTIDPLAQDLLARLAPPFWQEGGSLAHPLGTDNLGRDVLVRILYGSRVSLMVGFASVLVACGAGIALGLVSGYYGGRADSLIMRLADVFMAYPFMLLTISVIAVLGNSIFNLILVLGLSDWVTYARTIRGSVLSIKEKEFVLAAKSAGTCHHTILMRHVFPNVLSPILVLGTVRVANIIIWESGLSFLGMGVPPPMPTWGRMLAEGRVYIMDSWWLVTLPGLAIMLTILSINLLGDGLRDALDPRLRNIPR
ncbi:MAG: ABC transporter permease [Desulfobacterales bacterium]|jgi:peptide/nickel transport system permease protein|nr:ABC transporter permease [Desulfobacterales bacterium]